MPEYARRRDQSGDRALRDPSLPDRVLVTLAACSVVLGGLVAAVTGPWQLAKGSWLAAYLVLVCGVAQWTIGRLPSWLAAAPVPARLAWAQPVCWNLGNILVITGALAHAAVLVDVGAALLLATLAIAWCVVRRVSPHSRAARVSSWAYRSLLLVLLVSTPVGIVLAYLRDSG